MIDGVVMRVGIAFLGSPADAGQLAAEAEDAGADAFLCGETDHSAFGCAVAAGLTTRRLTVGTAVSLVFPRSPTIAAMEAWSLASVAPGRSLYGLGSQVRQVVERRFGAEFAPPVERMGEYVETMRRVLEACRTGRAKPFEGTH
jgi:alkanesulfonate monooxygenase SsuD/methylene tetrahydromethanopterin reductase-like flavin-dependent oxidoreductase (luciferase family)